MAKLRNAFPSQLTRWCRRARCTIGAFEAERGASVAHFGCRRGVRFFHFRVFCWVRGPAAPHVCGIGGAGLCFCSQDSGAAELTDSRPKYAIAEDILPRKAAMVRFGSLGFHFIDAVIRRSEEHFCRQA